MEDINVKEHNMGINFTQNIKKLLKEKNLTQKEFLIMNNIPVTSYANWKNGSSPNLAVANKIAISLGVSLDYLANDNNNLETFFVSKEENIGILITKNINKILKNRKITLKHFLEKIDLSKSSYVNWTRGVTPSIDIVLKISNALNITVENLCDGISIPKIAIYSEQVENFIICYEKLTDENKSIIDKISNSLLYKQNY